MYEYIRGDEQVKFWNPAVAMLVTLSNRQRKQRLDSQKGVFQFQQEIWLVFISMD